MPNIIDILARAQSLMNETALNSITPPRAGGIMYDTLLVLNQMQLEGASLLISKVYASVSAMEADTTPTSDLTGRALKPGQLVVIVTSDSSSSDMGSEYRYNGPGSWTYVGKVGGLPLDTEPTENSTKGITSGGVYNVKKDLEDDIESLDIQLNGATKTYTKDSGLTSIYSGYQIKVPAAGKNLANTTRANGTNYRNFRVPVTGAARVIYNSYASTSGYGSMFVDANDDVISGHSRPSSESNPITLDVPSNAVQFIWGINISNSDTFNTIQVIIEPDKIPTSKIEDAAVTTQKIANGAVTSEKLEGGAVQGAISGTEQDYVGFNLLNPSTSQVGYINKSNGNFISQSGVMATDFIPVNGKDIYAYCGDAYGSTGGCAVYDSNKAYLRANSSTKDYTYQEGDAYVRFTYRSTSNYQVICYKPAPTISGTFNPTYDEQDIIPFNGSQVFGADNIPVAKPAIASVGKDGMSATVSSLDGTAETTDGKILRITGWPIYIKNGQTVSARGKFSIVGEVRVGFNRQSTLGYFVRLTATNANYCKYTGEGDSYTTVGTFTHGLTLADYFDITFTMSPDHYKICVMTSDGAFVKEGDNETIRENYGVPFVEAVGSTVITGVTLRAISDKFRKPVWVVGDSYVSLYQQRWPYQMMYTFGYKDFLLDGLAGGASEGLFAELQKLFSLGCPKYLVWCLGMNDSSWDWRYYEKKVEMLCRANGVTLLLQTIPYPESGTNKEVINNEVRASGYRYIDAFDAVSSNSDGDWYDGYCDDGVHPTILGAKAIAAQVLADFPEICQ